MATRGPKQSRLETTALLQVIAAQTHLPFETVRLVVDTFTSVVREAVLQEERVIIRHFGAFFVKKITTGPMIKFKAAVELKKAIQEVHRPMEKYGVEMKNEAVLLAQVTGECPDCKEKLESTSPPKCSNCGTKPFENKETK